MQSSARQIRPPCLMMVQLACCSASSTSVTPLNCTWGVGERHGVSWRMYADVPVSPTATLCACCVPSAVVHGLALLCVQMSAEPGIQANCTYGNLFTISVAVLLLVTSHSRFKARSWCAMRCCDMTSMCMCMVVVFVSGCESKWPCCPSLGSSCWPTVVTLSDVINIVHCVALCLLPSCFFLHCLLRVPCATVCAIAEHHNSWRANVCGMVLQT